MGAALGGGYEELERLELGRVSGSGSGADGSGAGGEFG